MSLVRSKDDVAILRHQTGGRERCRPAGNLIQVRSVVGTSRKNDAGRRIVRRGSKDDARGGVGGSSGVIQRRDVEERWNDELSIGRRDRREVEDGTSR